MDYKIDLLRLIDKLNNHSYFHGKDINFSFNTEKKTTEYTYSSKGMETMEKVEEERAEGVIFSGILLNFDEEYVLNNDFINFIINKIDTIEDFNLSIPITDNAAVDFSNDNENNFKYIMDAGHGLDMDYDLTFNCFRTASFNNIDEVLVEIQSVLNILIETVEKLVNL